MNTDSAPLEIASYIVRESEGNVNQKKNKNYKKLCIRMAWIVTLVVMLVCGGYGIARQAAAHDTTENPVQTTAAGIGEQNAAIPETNEVIAEVAEAAEAADAVMREVAVAETSAEGAVKFGILSGDEVLQFIAQQEVTADYEENLSGLLWNYELIADIQKRVAEADAEAELFCDEDYRELLVTMGMDADYVSQDPELPEYLVKTYNPQMDIELTEEEISNLLRLVEAEAPAEDIYGKILVANVVLNRVNNEKMANTVTGVIFEKIGGSAQFSPTAISWYWNSIQVTDSTREAVARCLSGEDYSNGALYFYAWEKNPNKHKTSAWMRDLECLFTHGGHRFFR